MEEFIIHDSRFIYLDEKGAFLPLIFIEDRGNPGTKFWTLFNTDLFMDKWNLQYETSYFKSLDDIMDMVSTYGDYQFNPDCFGFMNRIWDKDGNALTMGQIAFWAQQAAYKNIKWKDIGLYKMDILIRDDAQGFRVALKGKYDQLRKHLNPRHNATVGLNITWDVRPEKLEDCHGFGKKLVKPWYAIKTDLDNFFMEMPKGKNHPITVPASIRNTKERAVCRKFKTEHQALNYCEKYSVYFRDCGYEIKQINIPAYL